MRLLLRIKRQGFVPDVIVGHPGWGETLFVKEVYPTARLIHFAEYYYRTSGADCGFDPEFPITLDDLARVRAKNALQLLALDLCDQAIAPTHWQKSLQPHAYHDKIEVVHEGIDTASLHPDTEAAFVLPGGDVLRAGDPVVTYVARNLEPYRGFHVFMRALPEILARNPRCRVVIAGGDGVSYGSKPAGAPDWRSKMLREVEIDPARVHFVGKIPYASYQKLLQVSAAHVYLTYPFVLSWSVLEAMACGCLVIGSDTAPVREVLKDRGNGLLVDFFDCGQLADTVSASLSEPDAWRPYRVRAAADAMEMYGLRKGLSEYRRMLGCI